MAGTQSRHGLVPKRIYPVFRDREELPTSADLGGMIVDALRRSRYLIVICSPHAAESRWVNEEIATFKRLGGSNRILSVIVDGEPNATDKPGMQLRECFPHTLRHHVDAQGRLSDVRTEPIAADARPEGDGRSDALLKVIAGVLGVGFDALKQRDLQRRQRRLMAITGAAIALSVVMVGLTIAALVARSEANYQRGVAVANERQSQERLTRSYVEQGWHRHDTGDLTAAYLRFAEALKQQPGEPEAQTVHRMRLALMRPRLAEPLAAFVIDHFTYLLLSNDGLRLFAFDGSAGQRPPTLFDCTTGETLATMSGDPIDAVFAADNRRVLTAHHGYFITWDEDGTPINRFEADSAPGGPFHFVRSETGRVIIVVAGSIATVWDGDSLAPTGASFTVPNEGASVMDAEGRLLAVHSDRVHVYDVSTGALLSTWSHAEAREGIDPRAIPEPMRHSSWTSELAFSRNGERIVVAGLDGLVQVRDTRSGQAVGRPIALSTIVNAVRFSPLGDQIITADERGGVHRWSASDGAWLGSAPGHLSGVKYLIAGDHTLVAASRYLETLGTTTAPARIATGGNPAAITLEESERIVTCASFAVDDRAGYWVVTRWRLPAPLAPARTLMHPSNIHRSLTEPDNSNIVTLTEGSTVRVWNAASGELAATASVDAEGLDAFGTVSGMAYRKGADELLLTTSDNRMQRRSLRTLEVVEEVPFDGLSATWQNLERIASSPDGTRCAIAAQVEHHFIDGILIHQFGSPGSEAGRVRVRDADGLASPIEGFEWTPDGSRIVVAMQESVAIVDADSGATTASWETDLGTITALAVSPDGALVATGHSTNRAAVWSAGGDLLCISDAYPTDSVQTVEFSPRGDRLLIASGDGSVRICHPKTGALAAPLMGHPGPVRSATFSPDGLLVLSTGSGEQGDFTARLWDTATGARIAEPFPHQVGFGRPAFISDGSCLMTFGSDTAAVWDLQRDSRDIDAIIRDAQRLSSRSIDSAGAETILPLSELMKAHEEASD